MTLLHVEERHGTCTLARLTEQVEDDHTRHTRHAVVERPPARRILADLEGPEVLPHELGDVREEGLEVPCGIWLSELFLGSLLSARLNIACVFINLYAC